MKNHIFRIYLLLISALFFVFVSSCKKYDDINNAEGIPALTTADITEITKTTAKSGGNITSDGGATITARGVCWSTEQNPTLSDSKTSDGTGTGSFVSNISGLSSNTTYYIRAYATNDNGTAYGNTLSFTTEEENEDSFTDPRDGNVYKYVTIGKQVWMTNNLRYLPKVAKPDEGSNSEAYYYVNGYYGTSVDTAKATSNYETFGVLYNWPAAMAGSGSSTDNPSRVQGVCPQGWHLPSENEWLELTEHLGGLLIAGGKLKEKGTKHWKIPNTDATNETDFTALPGGYRSNNGTFGGVGSTAYWWTTTETSKTGALSRNIEYNSGGIFKVGSTKDWGWSVRCLKD